MILALAAIVVVGAGAAAATNAFFSDTETSSGNTFTAGAIDLSLKNTSWYTDENGDLATSGDTTWDWDAGSLLFSFDDIKPGDRGSDAIGIKVTSNDAWVCADVTVTEDSDGTCVDPEKDAEGSGVCGSGVPTQNGDLADVLQMVWWADDGDAVLETGETVISNAPLGLAPVGTPVSVAIVDSNVNVFGGSGPLVGNTEEYIGKGYCAGTITLDAQSNTSDDSPAVRGTTGWTCNGASVDNKSQTDVVKLDVAFRAEQSRNNAGFTCGASVAPNTTTKVGSNVASYTAPSSCNVTVTAGNSINSGIASALNGQTVCVDPGTYTGNVDVNKEITLASTGGAGATIIDGAVNVSASNSAVKGFTIKPGYIPTTWVGVFLTSGVSNVLVSYNIFDGTSNANPDRGVETVYNGTYGAITVTQNDFLGLVTGVYTNPHTGPDFQITYNDFNIPLGGGSAAGIGGLSGADVMYNEFTSSVANAEAIGADSSYTTGSEVAFNNFLSGSKVNTYGTLSPDVDAEDNYWNLGSASQIGGTNEVDATPSAPSMFAHN